jgi:hypothetical protein
MPHNEGTALTGGIRIRRTFATTLVIASRRRRRRRHQPNLRRRQHHRLAGRALRPGHQQHPIDEDITDPDQAFKLLVVNADQSVGGRLTINDTHDDTALAGVHNTEAGCVKSTVFWHWKGRACYGEADGYRP